MNFKTMLMMVLMPLQFVESYYANKDLDTIGRDDQIAKFLGYARKGVAAIINDDPLPAAPKELKGGGKSEGRGEGK